MARAGSIDSFLPEVGQHALIAGKNGSGKTAFAVWALVRIPTAPVVIYDTKIEPKFLALPANKVVTSIEEMLEAARDEKIDYVIVRPPEEMLGKPQELDEYLWAHYLHIHYSVAYIDEGYTFHTRSGQAFKGLQSLMQRGRSKGITTIISTQRPIRIERAIISEMSKAYLFLLQDKRDREAVDNLIPDFSDLPVPKRHAFYFWETSLDQAILYEPVKLDQAFVTGYYDKPVNEDSNSKDEGNTSSETIQQKPPTKHVWV